MSKCDSCNKAPHDPDCKMVGVVTCGACGDAILNKKDRYSVHSKGYMHKRMINCVRSERYNG
jgi:hypothetical protein